MEAEHRGLDSFDHNQRKTWPANEWAITVGGNHNAPGSDCSSRKLQAIENLMQTEVVVRAGLHRCEVIAIVLYTGPMVSPIFGYPIRWLQRSSRFSKKFLIKSYGVVKGRFHDFEF